MRRSDDATTRRWDDAGDANNNADGEGGGGRTMRLPGGSGGSYCPHHQMGSTVHGFVRSPPPLTGEAMTTPPSAGGPAGSPPRLHVC